MHDRTLYQHLQTLLVSVNNVRTAYANMPDLWETASSQFWPQRSPEDDFVPDPGDQFWLNAFALINAATVTSQTLWPAKRGADWRAQVSSQRGETLRQLLSVQESSPLKLPAARRHVERLGERIDAGYGHFLMYEPNPPALVLFQEDLVPLEDLVEATVQLGVSISKLDIWSRYPRGISIEILDPEEEPSPPKGTDTEPHEP